MNFKELRERHEIIKKVVLKYRKEFTKYTAELGSITATYVVDFDKDSYIEYLNSLTEEEFVGNFLTAIYVEDTIEEYKKILNGEDSIEEFLNRAVDAFSEIF